jgi:hypothetical protein
MMGRDRGLACPGLGDGVALLPEGVDGAEGCLGEGAREFAADIAPDERFK